MEHDEEESPESLNLTPEEAERILGRITIPKYIITDVLKTLVLTVNEGGLLLSLGNPIIRKNLFECIITLVKELENEDPTTKVSTEQLKDYVERALGIINTDMQKLADSVPEDHPAQRVFKKIENDCNCSACKKKRGEEKPFSPTIENGDVDIPGPDCKHNPKNPSE